MQELITRSPPYIKPARLGHTQIELHLLLAAGADLGNNFDDRDFFTPLEVAAAKGNTAIVDLLISSLKGFINEQNYHGVTMLSRITSHHNQHLVRLLLEAGAFPNIEDNNGNTALHFAHYEGAFLLFAHGATIRENKKGATPLHFTNDPSVVDILLEHNPLLLDGTTRKGKTALYEAAKHDRIKVVTRLLDHGARFIQTLRGETPIYRATQREHEDVLRLLLDRATPSEVNLPADSGETPLDRSVSQGNPEIVRLLLQKGATPSVGALHMALKKKVLACFGIYESTETVDFHAALRKMKRSSEICALLEQALFPNVPAYI